MSRGNCARYPKCSRKAQTAGLCKQHYRAEMGGPVKLIDSAPTQEHIKRLAEAGLSGKRLATLVGMRQVSIWRISQQTRVLATTAAKILAIDPGCAQDMAHEGARVPVLGSARRLQALQVLGYTTADLSGRLGIGRRAINSIVNEQVFVTAKVARDIAALYEKLQLTNGSSEITKRRSLKKGWFSPWAWDDIDDPDDKPYIPMRGTREEMYTQLKREGLSDRDIAKEIGITNDALSIWLKRQREKEVA